MFVPLNIVTYNVFGGEGEGPNIFGVEPWYFYISNGFLNFNILFLLALASAPMVVRMTKTTCMQKSHCLSACGQLC